jgi:hypothetical protein
VGLARRTAILDLRGSKRRRISLCDLQNIRTTVIAFFLTTAPFLLHAQQQNEGDSPSGKIHFVVRGNEQKNIYLPPLGPLTGRS